MYIQHVYHWSKTSASTVANKNAVLNVTTDLYCSYMNNVNVKSVFTFLNSNEVVIGLCLYNIQTKKKNFYSKPTKQAAMYKGPSQPV